MRSSLSVGLVDAPRPAALNLYAWTPDAFITTWSLAVANLLARCVAALLSGAGPREPTEVAALRSQRATIRRAQSLIMSARGLSQASAFAELADLSVRQGRSMFDVAADLVLGSSGREPR